MCVDLRAKWRSLWLFGCGRNGDISRSFHKNLESEISQKSARQKPRCFMRADGRIAGHEAHIRFSKVIFV
jgi:hypothetical protein